MTAAPTLHSKRVELTPCSARDADDIVALHRDERVTRHLLDGIPDEPWKVDVYLKWASELGARGIGPWTARRRTGGTFLGLFTLTPVADAPDCLEFGGRLARAGWHGDLAVEAAGALIDHAFAGLGVARLCSIYHPDNPTAPVALQRLGFSSPVAVTMFGRDAVEVSLLPAAWAAQGRQAGPRVRTRGHPVD